MGPFSLGAKLKVNCGAAIVTKVRLQIKALRKQFRGSFAPDPSDPGSNPAGTTAHGVFKGKKGKTASCLNSHLVGSCHLFPAYN